MTVTYDANVGWQNMYKKPDLLNAKEYMAVMDQVSSNNGGSPYDWSKYIDADLLAAYQNGTNEGTNWLDQIVNDNAITTSHALNISGGSELSKFSTGVGYQYQDGIIGKIAKSDYRRFTFRLNSEHILIRLMIVMSSSSVRTCIISMRRIKVFRSVINTVTPFRQCCVPILVYLSIMLMAITSCMMI